MIARIPAIAAALLCCAPVIGLAAVDRNEPLTLSEAEQLAAELDPAGERFEALIEAREQAAIAAAQLPDPQLTTGLMNLPVDRPGLDRDPMTQLQIGLRQTFPRGESRQLEAAREQAGADRQRARRQDWMRLLRRTVRDAYFDVYDHTAALEILETTRTRFDELVEITEHQYASGTAAPEDIARARLERDLLEDRIADREQALATARAELAQWIGYEAAERPLPKEPPSITPEDETAGDESHPLLRTEMAQIRAEQHNVALAREAYKPQWSVEVNYGVRRAGHSDFLSGMVMVDLPLFTANRQDRRLAERQQALHAAQQSLEEQRRELASRRHAAERQDRYLSARIEAFEDGFMRNAEEHAETARRSYQNGLTPFNAVVRAELQVLEVQLETLALTTERNRQRAARVYLRGDDQ